MKARKCFCGSSIVVALESFNGAAPMKARKSRHVGG